MIDLADKSIYRGSLLCRLIRKWKRNKMRRRLVQLNYVESSLIYEQQFIETALGNVRVERSRIAHDLRRGELMR